MTISAPSPLSSARRSGAAFGLARLCGAVVLGATVAAAAASPALAQASGKSSPSGSKSDSFCASYGPGFQRVPGSDSCVKTGAVVRSDAYSGSSVSNAPNQFNNSSSSALPSTAAPAADPWKTAR
ncbi:hypothetical protein [Xanthobacter sp.]|uniref:hypothetical protein n=1 Tax=Xanthobacter sp. TaxID=35809 RepID=UPI0035B13647